MINRLLVIIIAPFAFFYYVAEFIFYSIRWVITGKDFPDDFFLDKLLDGEIIKF